MNTKICTKCNEEKELDDFHTRKLKNNNISYRNECKQCRREIERQRRLNNLEKFIERDKSYYKNNKDKISAKQKIYNIINRDAICENKKLYYQNNKETIKDYHQKNKDKRNKRLRKFRNSNPIARAINSLRTRIHDILKNYKKSSSFELIGCSKEELIKWLESQFYDDISWENYGIIWHIDHVLAMTLFDLTKIEAQRRCCHWSNLRPLIASENISKSNNIIISYVKNHVKTLKLYISQNIGYQTKIENSWWRRLQLRYGENSEDREDYQDLLKWAIRIEDASASDDLSNIMSNLKI